MNVSELIKWLKTQDQGATVEVVKHKSEAGYHSQGGESERVKFSSELSEYTDLRGNKFITNDAPYFNERTLLLGEING